MSKFESVKNHLRRNKVTYIACGATAVVVAGTTYYFTRNGSAAKAIAATTEFFGETVVHNAPTMKQTVCWKPTMQNIVEFVETSTPSKQVGLLDQSGNVVAAFRSIGEAARQTGLTKNQISKVINGMAETAEGMKFTALEQLAQAA